MSHPIVLSDEEDQNELSTPFHPIRFKKRRTEPDPTTMIPTVLVLDDDPTPKKPGLDSTPSFVPETPMSDVAIVKCTTAVSDPQTSSSNFEEKFSGINGLICLESDNESEGGNGRENWKHSEAICSDFGSGKDLDRSFTFAESTCSFRHADVAQISEDYSCPTSLQDDIPQVRDSPDKGHSSMDQMEGSEEERRRSRVNVKKKNSTSETMGRKKMTKEERDRLVEEKKLKKLQEKLQKAALKAEAAELKKVEKEKKKWENGKFALKSIVAEIDAKVVELGSIGGNLLTRFAEKGLTYRITSNPIERSIIWTMNFPEHISQLSSKGVEIQYVMLVYEAEEFCDLVINESLLDHVYGVRNHYPSHTVCYLTNRLMPFINKREQEHYKNPTNYGWRRPLIEEVLAKITTHFVKVHSRQCVDEAELAEHIVGLTCSLACCQYRKKLTRLSVNANVSLIPKDSINRNLIKKSLCTVQDPFSRRGLMSDTPVLVLDIKYFTTWLKTLVAIPKVQPRFAIAIWKKYPTMKSLLSVYMDPSKSVHEKEFLLKDLTTEGLLGGDRRLGEVCSKRVYRILMAQSGCIKTDEIEEGADFFRC